MTAVDFESFVDTLATVSGEAILPFFRTSLGIDDKALALNEKARALNHKTLGVTAKFDPVTEADRAAEAVMRRMIKATFPQHGIIGEEFGSENEGAEYVWVLDPIDGTRSFISGIPLWGTLIGLMHHGLPSYGVMNQPFTSERFRGDGRSAWCLHRESAPRRLSVRTCTSFAQATLMTTSPALFTADQRARYDAIEGQTRLARYGGDCYAYCMVAAGHVDLVIEAGLKPYDIVALVPIIEGAGGIVTNWQGNSPADGGSIIACGDKRLHEQVVRLLES